MASATRQPTGAEVLIRCLEREGVRYIFGLSGGAAIPIFDALVDSEIELILVRHEQGATHMADGFARASGQPGVVLVTSGPGATNTVTGLLTAQMDSSPLIVISGQTNRVNLGKDAFQEADVTGITYPVVKHSYLVRDAAEIPRIVREAFHIAATGRPGPVHVDLPKDVLVREAEFAWPEHVYIRSYNPTYDGHPGQIKRAARSMLRARRPVLYVGGGAIIADAHAELRRLAERTQIPVTTTPAARADWQQFLDVAILFACLGVAVWLVHKQRSRRGLFWLGIFSLAYFGFWRKGCVCAIGAPRALVRSHTLP